MRRLFLDLDGVLADFERGVVSVTGQRPEELSAADMWQALRDASRFFETLDMMHDAETLWQFCKPFQPTILTGMPRGAWASAQKKNWVARVLGTSVEVITCYAYQKPLYAVHGAVLVDDLERARDGWERAGGVFVHHTGSESSITRLKELGFEL